MARLLPPDSMKMVYSVLADVLTAHRRAWLLLGMLGMLWVATAAFDALIEALSIAYDAIDDRPFWKTRLLALALAVICGALFLAGLGIMLVGSALWRMAGFEHGWFRAVRSAVARFALGHCDWIYRVGGGVVVLSSALRKAEICGDSALGVPGRWR